MLTEDIKADATLRAVWNAAIDHAAGIASPPLMHRKGKPGAWRMLRKRIADDIVACKLDSSEA